MKKRSLLAAALVCWMLSTHVANAQHQSLVTASLLVYFPAVKTDIQPQFPGGDAALIQFIEDHLLYPASARENGVEGIVKVAFTVKANGTIVQPEIMEGLGHGCDEEVIRVVKEMPKWIPGMVNNTTMARKVILPISFKLNW